MANVCDSWVLDYKPATNETLWLTTMLMMTVTTTTSIAMTTNESGKTREYVVDILSFNLSTIMYNKPAKIRRVEYKYTKNNS